ncbi:hypothetical protein [Streptomyces jumonjinensis]|uniref:hypothetical protein n=1 Tax=Streptomyces jumonjinensis TaxID=1945 RepID=UPI00129562FC|nr:hypothetical protein [Streptomyces jumonjinensis]
MTPQTSRGIAFRNGVVRLAGHVPGKELLMRSQVRMSDSYPLDDYSRHLVGAGRS